MNKLTAELLQQLKSAAQEEIMCREASDTSDAWQDLASPENILLLVEIALPVLEQQDGWISCSERMPDEREQVILWDAELDEHTSGHYSDQTGNFYNGGMIIDNEITHWKPAPARPHPTTDTYQQIENDDWIEWGGGDCPVEDCTWVVVVKFRDGETGARHAGGYRWAHYGKYNDIIAYRVIENDGREG